MPDRRTPGTYTLFLPAVQRLDFPHGRHATFTGMAVKRSRELDILQWRIINHTAPTVNISLRSCSFRYLIITAR